MVKDIPKASLEMQRAALKGNLDTIVEGARTIRTIKGLAQEQARFSRGEATKLPPLEGTLNQLRGLTDSEAIADRAVAAAAGATLYYRSPEVAARITDGATRETRAKGSIDEAVSALRHLQATDPFNALVAFSRVLEVDPLIADKIHDPRLSDMYGSMMQLAGQARQGRSPLERRELHVAKNIIRKELGSERHSTPASELPGMPKLSLRKQAEFRAFLANLRANGVVLSPRFAGWLPVVESSAISGGNGEISHAAGIPTVRSLPVSGKELQILLADIAGDTIDSRTRRDGNNQQKLGTFAGMDVCFDGKGLFFRGPDGKRYQYDSKTQQFWPELV